MVGEHGDDVATVEDVVDDDVRVPFAESIKSACVAVAAGGSVPCIGKFFFQRPQPSIIKSCI